MSIRVLHTEWSNGWGGQEIRIIEEMKAMRELYGVESFIACREDAKIAEKAKNEGFQIFTLPFKGNTDIATLLKLRKIIREHSIDIVNTHSGKDTWVGGLAAKISGASFIRTRHLSNPINPSRLNFINELADYIITTGESVRDDMIKRNRINPDKIVSIPTGIDENRFNPNCCEKLEARGRLGVDRDRLVIGIVAVLRSFKRHDIFIENARAVLKKYPDTLFIIAGDGPQREKIEELISEYGLRDNILMLGHIDNPELAMKAMDIFILSSDSKEGVPQSVIQALLMELPVIATDVGSTKDLYNGENMILIPPKDRDALLKATISLIEEKELRNKLSKNARESAYPFKRSEMAKKVYEVYNKILN